MDQVSIFRQIWWVTDNVLGLLSTSCTIWIRWPWEDHTKVEGENKMVVKIDLICAVSFFK